MRRGFRFSLHVGNSPQDGITKMRFRNLVALWACLVGLAEALSVEGQLRPDGEMSARKAVQAVEVEAMQTMDAAFADAFTTSNMLDDEEPEPDAVETLNSAREEGVESKCDPNQPPDPASFGGQKSLAEVDMPDPGCGALKSCGACMQNRKCGWCAGLKECKMARSESKDCANNLNTDVCSPPCPEMWHMSWPEGRMGIVTKLCKALADDYSMHAQGRGEMAIHFAD